MMITATADSRNGLSENKKRKRFFPFVFLINFSSFFLHCAALLFALLSGGTYI
jgi:hypothetical protein